MAQKIDFDINKLDWLAIARVMAPILAPVILAIAWTILAKNNKTVDWLSNVFAVAELTPGVDLNLPSGVVLGSFYNSAKEVEPTVTSVLDFVKDLAEDVTEVKEAPLSTLWDWLTFDVRETEGFKER
tara:strand:- start:495 stop:875 length:381 start_codon:yes stop_codon:yes gene_type:complete